ncbi:MAG: hypothetical protein K2L51_07845 [Clostridiales bacterium]|nr:hypothetical protein [Clostridiales bacterium]
MRWHIKRTKLLFALIPIISIAFYILTANNNIFADQSFSAFDIYKQISDTAELTPGKDSPADYTAAENFAIAAGVYLKADAVQSVTNGTVTAMGFYKQTVLNEHIRYNGHIFSESISLSAIASVAEQRYFKDGALLFRKGNASGNAVKSWSDSITELTTAVFRQRYGVVPQEITKYSVTKESITEGKLISHNADGTHTYELTLDPELAQQYARYEMMTFAGVTAFPNFLSCRLVFTIDDTWHIQTLESYDTYKIDLMGGIKCDSRLTETYSFENVSMPDRAQIFIDYVPTGNAGGVDDERGPADYLNEAFGDYISGQRALCLTADFDIRGETLPLRARIDIAGGDYRFMLGNEIFAAYTGNDVYVKAGENKYTLSVADALALAKSAGGGKTPARNLSAADLLGILFENYTLTQTDTHVYIRMPFTLFGVDLDVNMGLRKTDEEGHVTADTIDATIQIAGVTATADIRITDAVLLPEIAASEYVSLSPLLTAVKNTVELPAYMLGGNIEADVNGKKIAAQASVRLVKTQNGLQAEGTLTALGQNVNVWYADETVYVRLGNYGVRARISDLPAVLHELAALLPENAPALNAAALLPQILPHIFPADVRISDVLGMLGNLSYNGNALSVAGKNGSFALTHNDILRTLSATGNVQNAAFNAMFTLNRADATGVAIPQEQDFRDVKEFMPYIAELRAILNELPFGIGDLAQFVTPLKNLLASETILLNANGSITLPAQTAEKKDANGNTTTVTQIPSESFGAGITLRLPKRPSADNPQGTDFALAATLTLSGQTFNVALKNNDAGKLTLYIQAGTAQNSPAFRLQLDQTADLLGKLSPLLGNDGAVALLHKLAPLLGDKDFTQTAQTLVTVSEMFAALGESGNGIGGIVNALSAYVQMPSFDFAALKNILSGIRVEQGKLSLSLPVGDALCPLSIAHNGTHFTALTLGAFSVNDATVKVDANVTHNAPLDLGTIQDENYFDLHNFTAYVPVLGELLTANALRIDITEGTLNTPFISGTLAGSVEIGLAPSLAVQCKLTLTDSGNGKTEHNIELRYVENRFYARINNIYVSFTADEIGALKAQLENLTGNGANGNNDGMVTLAEVSEWAIETVSVLKEALGGNSLAELFAHIGSFTPNGNGFTVSASIDAFNITASVAAGKNSDNRNMLALDIINFQYGSIVSENSALKAAVTAANGITADTEFEANKNSYVTLAQLSEYIAATVDLTKREKIGISFFGSVKEEDGSVSAIGAQDNKGALHIVRTAHFMHAYVYMPLTVKGATHNIGLTLIDGNTAEAFHIGNLTAYLDYDQGDNNKVFRAKISSGATLGIVGSLCDVLNVKLPDSVEKVLQSAGYEHFPTNVFTTMDIKGLDSLRDTLNKILGTSEDAADMADGGMANMLGAISGDTISKVLKGVTLTVNDGALNVEIENSVFGAGNAGAATVRFTATDAGIDMSIDNLVARGDTVNFTANAMYKDGDAAFTVAEPQQDAYYDFSTIDDLLYSVIRTADMRAFEIDASAKISIPVISDITLPVNVKVQILDDGSTVAAIKLQVPSYSLIVELLEQTDSYIYYANERLYFVVDRYKKGKYSSTEYTSATIDEFMANAQDYLFFLLRMNGTLKNFVLEQIGKSTAGTPSTHPQDILKSFSVANNAYSLKLGLGELSGNSSLGDLDLTLATTADGYIKGLSIETTVASAIGISLQNATLGNLNVSANNTVVKNDDGNPALPLSFVSFGQNAAFKSLTFSARNKDGVPVENSGNLADIESDLQKIFAVEGAETATGKAAKAAEKLTAQTARMQKANTAAADARKDWEKASAELAEAENKLASMPEGAFGRDLIESQVAFQTKRVRQLFADLTEAQATRVAEAQAAAQYAETAYNAAIAAAQAANGVLTRNTALDHNGFTTDAGVTLGAITAERAQAAYTQAYDTAVTAANAARAARITAEQEAQAIADDCDALRATTGDALQQTKTDAQALQAQLQALQEKFAANPIATAVRHTLSVAIPANSNAQANAQTQANAMAATASGLDAQTYGKEDYAQVTENSAILQESANALTDYAKMLNRELATVKNLPVATLLQAVQSYLTETEYNEAVTVYNALLANYLETQKTEYEKALAILQQAYATAKNSADKITAAANNLKKDGFLGLADGDQSKAAKNAASAAQNAVAQLQTALSDVQNAIQALTA